MLIRMQLQYQRFMENNFVKLYEQYLITVNSLKVVNEAV